MNDDRDSLSTIALCFCLALGLVFIHLKLSGAIGWHWGYVLAPVYGPFVLLALYVNAR